MSNFRERVGDWVFDNSGIVLFLMFTALISLPFIAVNMTGYSRDDDLCGDCAAKMNSQLVTP